MEIYHFLFETYAGIAVLVGAGLVLSLIVCVIMEIRTRKRFSNHEVTEDEDEWSLIDDVVESEAEEEVELEKKKG